MKPLHCHQVPLYVPERQPTTEIENKLFATISYRMCLNGIYFGDETVHETTDSTILSYRSAFPYKEEVQVAQIFVDAATRYICQWCYIDAISFTHVRLNGNQFVFFWSIFQKRKQNERK